MAKPQMVCTSQDERTDEEEDYYKILELGSDAGPSEIRTAYLRLIKLHHPDKLKPSHHHPASTVHSHSPQQPSPTDHQYAQSLILAYSTLIEPARRIEYDLKRLKSNPAHKQSLIIIILVPSRIHQLPAKIASSGSDSKIVSQVLDLSEFTQLTVDQPEQEAPDTVGGGDRFVFPCRCGGQFLISENQMEADIEIIGCDGCSLTVKVEYQSE
ncbi:hypothetical protein PSTT_14801 [Puccinia striiformis]|uniref:Diphthamide biosynthesis protein 4 n=1 Tax=Puccinia striiformis TaxID=27350 RepID=A0A2S4UKK2_9BASI|nr:hypothetical protein PSTT_14801 [Puccinia striiformis]